MLNYSRPRWNHILTISASGTVLVISQLGLCSRSKTQYWLLLRCYNSTDSVPFGIWYVLIRTYPNRRRSSPLRSIAWARIGGSILHLRESLLISIRCLASGRCGLGTGRTGCCCCASWMTAIASTPKAGMTNDSSILLMPVSTMGPRTCSVMLHRLPAIGLCGGCATRGTSTSRLFSPSTCVGLFSSGLP